MLHLVEDEFDALNIVYFYGTEYNADEFITEGMVSPHALDEANPDENKLSLLLKTITVNEID